MAAEEAANWVLANIKPAPPGSAPFSTVTDDQLLMLHFLFDKNLEKAMRIIDQEGVHRLVAEPSGRAVFQVVGESKGKSEYLCFPEHFCSCHSFFYDIVSRGHHLYCTSSLCVTPSYAAQSTHQQLECERWNLLDLMPSGGEVYCSLYGAQNADEIVLYDWQCKHQLAAKLAVALQSYKCITMSDIQLTELLLDI